LATRCVEPARPTGYSWGYSADSPHDLARNILYDRLWYVPAIVIYSQFCNDIVNKTCQTLHPHLQASRRLVQPPRQTLRRNPRAEPFDPYAADGA
jgi:hypothetical protein